jgi:hypothetical protein
MSRSRLLLLLLLMLSLGLNLGLGVVVLRERQDQTPASDEEIAFTGSGAFERGAADSTADTVAGPGTSIGGARGRARGGPMARAGSQVGGGPGPGGPHGRSWHDRGAGSMGAMDLDQEKAATRRRASQLARLLDLTPQQQADMLALRLRVLPDLQAARVGLAEARRSVHDLILAAAPADSVRLQVRHLDQAQARLDSLVAETLLSEVRLLSTEQRRRYMQLMPWETGPRGHGRRNLHGGGNVP